MKEPPVVNAALIRALYPSPCEPLRNKTGGYCVGGALMLTLGEPLQRFPSVVTLSVALEDLNPTLGCGLPHAAAIIQCNDIGLFQQAWHVLDCALTPQ